MRSTKDPTPEQIEARRREGYNGFFEGLSINQNPYVWDHIDLFNAWKYGWYKAKREVTEEQED